MVGGFQAPSKEGAKAVKTFRLGVYHFKLGDGDLILHADNVRSSRLAETQAR